MTRLLLEPGAAHLEMAERLLRAAQRFERVRPLRAEGRAQRRAEGAAPCACLGLWPAQAPVLRDFGEYLLEVATRPVNEPADAWCRIILPPRTGKTVVAAQIVAWTGLEAAFVVPTRTLLDQAARMLAQRNPGVPIGRYCGEEKAVVAHGINVVTYAMLHRGHTSGTLPPELQRAGLVFVDEAHHAMTRHRLAALRTGFDPRALRIGLTATPDYDAGRRLDRYFPDLIHEIGMQEAYELGLLAPLRFWLAEVDADASQVRVVAGDYDEGALAEVMSEAPFFKAVELFRYGGTNAQRPALVACATRQQAVDLEQYLLRHRPPGASPPALILGETPDDERRRILADYERGLLDTLVQVRVLIEGFSSPRCKLLVDLAPSLSRVRATQKYFRVMTRDQDAEARIYVVVPSRMPCLPVLPTELFADLGCDYDCGELLTPRPGVAAPGRVHETDGTPIAGVTLRRRLLASARFERPALNPAAVRSVRTVLSSCPEFAPAAPPPLARFRNLLFHHPLFTGRGDFLLRWLKHPVSQSGYWAFLGRYCPGGAAGRFLLDQGHGASPPERTCLQELEELVLPAPGQITPQQRDVIASMLLALSGGAPPAAPDAPTTQAEGLATVAQLLEGLPPRGAWVLTHLLGLDGSPPCTLTEVGRLLGVTSSRVMQLRRGILARIRWHVYQARARLLAGRPLPNDPPLAEWIAEGWLSRGGVEPPWGNRPGADT